MLGSRKLFRFNTLDPSTEARLNDIVDKIEPLLLARMRHVGVRHGLMGFETMMLGETEQRGHEHIVVCCRSQIFEILESFFEKNKTIKELCAPTNQTPTITIIVHGQEPRSTARLMQPLISMAHTIDEIEAPWNAEDGKIEKPTLCGSLLKLKSSQEVVKTATGGGLIKVVSKAGQSMLYGMTAGHVFSEEALTSTGERSIVEIGRVIPRAFPYRRSERRERGGLDPNSKVWKRGVTENGPDFDWALLESKDLLEFGANRCRSKNSSRIAVDKVLTTEIGTFAGDEIYQEVEMIAHTKFCRPGMLSGAPARILFEDADAFTPAYILTLSEGKVGEGDSGAWVVGASSHNVFGHIVAANMFGDAYVLPLDQTFKDIQRSLNAESVQLASSEDFTPTNYDELPFRNFPGSHSPEFDNSAFDPFGDFQALSNMPRLPFLYPDFWPDTIEFDQSSQLPKNETTSSDSAYGSMESTESSTVPTETALQAHAPQVHMDGVAFAGDLASVGVAWDYMSEDWRNPSSSLGNLMIENERLADTAVDHGYQSPEPQTRSRKHLGEGPSR